MDVLAHKGRGSVSQHGSWKQSRFQQDLKPVADAKDQPAGLGEASDRSHHRGEPRNRAGAKIVAVGEAAGNDDRVYMREHRFLVPEEVCRGAHDLGDGMLTVTVTAGAAKGEDGSAQ